MDIEVYSTYLDKTILISQSVIASSNEISHLEKGLSCSHNFNEASSTFIILTLLKMLLFTVLF